MRNAIIGLVVGVVVGVVVGTTMIAPRLKGSDPVEAVRALATQQGSTDATQAKDKKDVVIGPPVHWRLESAYSEKLPLLGRLAKHLETGLSDVSDGKVAIEFHGPGELVEVANLLDAVKHGNVDAAFASPALWEDKAPALAVFAGLPFGPPPRELLAWLEHGGGRAIHDKIYADMGLKALPCGVTAGAAAGWFRKPVRRPEDFTGLTIRATGLAAKVLAKLGAKPKKLSPGQILSAFEQGDIDAAMFSTPAVDRVLGLQKMAHYYQFPGWQRPAQLYELVTSLKAWEALSPTAQAQVRAVCGDDLHRSLAESGAVQYGALKKLTEAGVQVSRWPAPVIQRLRTAWQQVAKEMARKDPAFAKAQASLEAFRRDYAVWLQLSRL